MVGKNPLPGTFRSTQPSRCIADLRGWESDPSDSRVRDIRVSHLGRRFRRADAVGAHRATGNQSVFWKARNVVAARIRSISARDGNRQGGGMKSAKEIFESLEKDIAGSSPGEFISLGDRRLITLKQLESYLKEARNDGIRWAAKIAVFGV